LTKLRLRSSGFPTVTGRVPAIIVVIAAIVVLIELCRARAALRRAQAAHEALSREVAP